MPSTSSPSTPFQALVIPAVTAAILLALAGCAPTPVSGTLPGLPPSSEQNEGDRACEIGHWVLDVADFESQVGPFLVGKGIPIVDVAVTGEGQLDIAEDDIIDGVMSLRTTGTLVPPGADPIAVDVPSGYTFSGNWQPGATDGTLDLSNWAQVADPGLPVDEYGITPSFFDFTEIPTVSSECTADTLRLQGQDAPFSTLWHRS
jgi:hypothetical protein